MTIELTNEEKLLLVRILKRLRDEDITELLLQDKQVLDFFASNSDESAKAQIEISYKNLLKKIEIDSGFDNRK